jgi:hypothetical protein
MAAGNNRFRPRFGGLRRRGFSGLLGMAGIENALAIVRGSQTTLMVEQGAS